jgi:hypothetical protein
MFAQLEDVAGIAAGDVMQAAGQAQQVVDVAEDGLQHVERLLLGERAQRHDV